MASVIETFHVFSGILVICPCCKEIVRLTDLRLLYTGKVRDTFLDDIRRQKRSMEQKEENLERQIARFEERECSLRQEAARKGCEKMRERLHKIEPALRKLKHNPDDIKVLRHPVDLIIFDGLNDSAVALKIILVNRSGSRNIQSHRKQVVKALEGGRFKWETVQIDGEGTVHVYN